jgi:hypothetical protein
LYKLLGHHAEENGAKRRKLIAIEEQEERTSQDQEQASQKCKQKVIDNFVTETFPRNHERALQKRREEVRAKIFRFLCTSVVPFNAVRNAEFGKMVHIIGKFGKGHKPVYFWRKEVRKMVNVIIKKSGKNYLHYHVRWVY